LIFADIEKILPRNFFKISTYQMYALWREKTPGLVEGSFFLIINDNGKSSIII